MPILHWISDRDFLQAVDHLLLKASTAKAQAHRNFGKNVIDPFSALFEISGFEINYQEWVLSESNRQAQKTLQNHIGDFHQRILGSVNGWQNMGTGSEIDLVCQKSKIVAEVKNKYNTLSGGKLSDLYYTLDALVEPKSSIYKGYTAYYVAIVPKRAIRYDHPFCPSDKSKGKKCPENMKIREIDGSGFYQLVTGDSNALKDLFAALPTAIEKCTGKRGVSIDKSLWGFFEAAFG